jgi:hypothetical protein
MCRPQTELLPERALRNALLAGTFSKEVWMPNKRAGVKNEKQYEALKDKGMSKERAARIANSPGAPSRGGKAAARKSCTTRTRTTNIICKRHAHVHVVCIAQQRARYPQC